ncbi:MAG TPA: ROK family protein [Steroidobacteraceae bacterium]|jgi:glucokinase
MRGASTATGAVDIGGTKIAVGIVDERGKLLDRQEMPTAAAEGAGEAFERIGRALVALQSRTGTALGGIGIGCTGPVDPLSGEIGVVEFLPGWQGSNPVRALADRFDVTVAMENDADAAALAEAQWGAGRGKRSLICVTVGTGIGGGIVLNGSLYRGVGGAHPEIGHHVIDDSGPQCFCGARGCWEVLARGPAMVERVLRESPAAREGLTAQQVCESARSGDPLATREVAREGRYLGLGIANLITLYVPEMIVLAGSVMDSLDLFLPAIRGVVRGSCGLVPAERVEIAPAALGAAAPLVGAAAVWLHRLGRTTTSC